MKKFKVRPTLKASTDNLKAGEMLEKAVLLEETKVHSEDVGNLLNYLMRFTTWPDRKKHDWSKLEYIDLFLDNINKKNNGEIDSFYDHEWWNIHITNEKHHALDYKGDDKLLLIDFIHMLCDWVAAGRARNPDGEFKVLEYHKGPEFEEKIRPLLFEAFNNTLDWLVEHTEPGELAQTEEVDASDDATQTEEVDVAESEMPDSQIEEMVEQAEDLESKSEKPPQGGDPDGKS
jgi:hypothetical protein